MCTLYRQLKEYAGSDYYGFHMPGHKRNPGLTRAALPYGIDITEIEGFDDLHHADGVLKNAQERAADVYHADETHFLINGSTAGILSAVAGAVKKGDTILVARNCHKSVYHAIYMNELSPVYLFPDFNREVYLNVDISVQKVKAALENNPDIRAVVIVSPTYDGVVSDVGAIADAAHEKGIPLIVDEAHGAHFGFHPYFPENANIKGADIVIHSLHKTLPSLTQTALLHMNGELVDRRKVRKYLHILQSSSPSYVLMASIDACIGMLESRGPKLFDAYADLLKSTRKKLGRLKNLKLVQTAYFDPSKLVISVKDAGIGSRELYRMLLEEYHLQMEMAAGTYILAMTSVGDTCEGMDRLTEALFEIDKKLEKDSCGEERVPEGILFHPEIVYNSSDVELAADAAAKSEPDGQRIQCLPWEKCKGYISLEYAYLYPPGTPLLVPGERITEKVTDILLWYAGRRFSIEGLGTPGCIEVLKDG